MFFNLIATPTIAYPTWYVGLCVALGIAYAAVLYYRDSNFGIQSAQEKFMKSAMAIFRFFAATILAILLLSPFLKNQVTNQIDPVVVLLQDNSSSVRLGFSSSDSTSYIEQVRQLKNELSAKYELVSFAIGESIEQLDAFDFKADGTNLSNALDGIADLYRNQNVGAVILATDGIYNSGISPVYAKQLPEVPIYTIGLGDTTRKKDLKFSEVKYNKIVYLGDRFTVQSTFEAFNARGINAKIRLSSISGGSTTQRQEVTINQQSHVSEQEFIVEAGKPGIMHLRLTVQAIEGEVSTDNNVRDLFIEVLDSRKKILLLSHAPHPDIAAIRKAIDQNRNYEIDVVAMRDFSASVNDFDLVILHQLPSANYSINALIDQLNKQKIPRLFIMGGTGSIVKLNKLQSVMKISPKGGSLNEISATASLDFSAFSLSDEITSALQEYPPLYAPFAEFELGGGSVVCLNQKIGSIKTDYPLLVFSELLEQRVGVLAAEGIWRWRLNNYLRTGNHEAFDELLGKVVQYLAVRDEKRQFRVLPEKTSFKQSEDVKFSAQLYNSSYELYNDPTVSLTIVDAEKQEYPFNFERTSNVYRLNAGSLPPGVYDYNASVVAGGKEFRANGKITVVNRKTELLKTQADHDMLKELSAMTEGRFFTANQLNQLQEVINQRSDIKPLMYQTYQTEAVISMKWIFILIVFLLGGEWFLRKYNGAY